MQSLRALWGQLPASARAALKVLALALVAGVTITATVSIDWNGDGQPDSSTTVTLPVAPAPAEFDAKPEHATLPPSASGEIPGASDATEKAIAEANRKTTAEQTYDTSGVLAGAAAQPARVKCYTPMNGGPRSLQSIALGVVHVTVSRNVPGLLDVNTLCGFFRRVKASPTWTVDNEANSAENVPLGRVPWTQVFYNRKSCSIEFVGSTGRLGEGAAEWTLVQLREGARLMARCFRLAGIPARRGAVTATGLIVKTGIVTHQELGRPGGGHTDPGPRFDMGLFVSLVKRYAYQARVTKSDKALCRKLTWWRTSGRPHGLPERRAVDRRKALERRHLSCVAGRVRHA